MRILLTGGSGQLGTDLKEILGTRGQAPPRRLLDVGLPESMDIIRDNRPELVIHAAAMTDVDACEANPERAYRVNVLGTRYVARACQQLGIPLIYVSTDFVFDGRKGAPYVETDEPNPLNVYGRTKLQGEAAVDELLDDFYIVRSSWLYGRSRSNFIWKVLSQVTAGKTLRVVTTQYGSPTSTRDLAQSLLRLAETGCYGLYHLANEGSCSRYHYASRIIHYANLGDVAIEPVTAYPVDAERPANTTLKNVRAARLGITLRHWEDALQDFVVSVVYDKRLGRFEVSDSDHV